MGFRPLNPPDEGLNGLQLAEIEGIFPRSLIVPVLQQFAGDDGHARAARLAPRLDTAANPVDLIQWQSALGVVARIKNFRAGGPAPWLDDEIAAWVFAPMLLRAGKGGIDDQGHSLNPQGT